MTTTLLTDRLFDGHATRPGTFRLTLEGERIRSVDPLPPGTAPAPGDLDARGCTVLPGLINTHVHIARGGMFEADEPLSVSQVVENLQQTLAAGVTTVADMGCPAPMIRALRRRTKADPLAGPDILGAGPLVTAPGGYPLDWLPPLLRWFGVASPCATEAEGARAAQAVAEAGMDHVKLAVMHESYAGRPLPAIALEVARALVTEAHRLGLRVYAHAHGDRDYQVALGAGVDALMHSSFEPLAPSTLAQVRDLGVHVCPTLWVFESACLGAEHGWHHDARFEGLVARRIRRSWERFCEAYAASGDVVPQGIAGGLPKERGRQAVQIASANLKLLLAEQVPIAFGNDAAYGFCLHGRPIEELLALHRAGIAPADVLRAATAGAATLLRLADRGALAPGLLADLVVAAGDAEADLQALERPRAVFHRGRKVTSTAGALRLASSTAAVVGGLLSTAASARRA